jgi:hypothetical protein
MKLVSFKKLKQATRLPDYTLSRELSRLGARGVYGPRTGKMGRPEKFYPAAVLAQILQARKV